MATTKAEEQAKLWTRENIMSVENRILQQVMLSRTPEAVESAIAYTRFLRLSGLTSDNYPLFKKMLEIENHWVLDALIGARRSLPLPLNDPAQPLKRSPSASRC